MATINNIYVFVEQEDISRESEVTQHAVEKGYPITSTARVKSRTLNISGLIVKVGSKEASTIIKSLENLQKKKSLIDYKGKEYSGNYLIKSFKTSNTNKVWGGASFEMELVQVKIAQSAYKKKVKKQANNSKKFKENSKALFTGGPVYSSATAKKSFKNKKKFTCKIIKISTDKSATHKYRIESTDGKKFRCWVDAKKLKNTGNKGTAKLTTGGQKQKTKK